ncbi:MAG: NAD(P)/FAD-dependent oxidoreductase [Phycisphaerae bacterium]|nr:NAD(P)/FAD-dependent oxidoreductase [Phycisphaerae bacterium]
MISPAPSGGAIDLSRVGREIWDLLVIGSGPAGSIAARQAALRGARVLLVDRSVFPREKVCGCCIGHAGMRALRSIGLGHVADHLGAPHVEQLQLHVARTVSRIALPAGRALSRSALDSALLAEAVRAGAVFHSGVVATVGRVDGDVRGFELKNDAESVQATARVVIAADGLASPSTRDCEEIRVAVAAGARVGVGARFVAEGVIAANTIEMHVGREGYLGLVRLEDGSIDAAAALDPIAIQSAGVRGCLTAILQGSAGERLTARVAAAEWRGTPPLTRRRTPVAAERLLLIGDAAGYVEPFTGEGMTWAMETAIAAAPIALEAAKSWSSATARRWIAEHRRLLAGRQWSCGVIAHLLRMPRAMMLANRLLSVAPALARPVVRHVAGPA